MNSRRIAEAFRTIAAACEIIADEVAPERPLEVHEPELEANNDLRRAEQLANEMALHDVLARLNPSRRTPRA